jgi:uncharacterized protein YjbI with pentapeptide repeats
MAADNSWPPQDEVVHLTAAEVLKAYARGVRNFRFANIDHADLVGADLRGASFYYASMIGVNLSGASLIHVQLKGARLIGASLDHASVGASNLIAADFSHATLRNADLTGATLMSANLTNADLTLAWFNGTSLGEAILEGANLTRARLSHAHLFDLDARPLCSARRLKHESPSFLDARTVMRSYNHPGLKQFMIDCGVPPIFADYMIDCASAIGESLMSKLMQSTFISYGGPDEAFARRLYESLRSHQITVFFFPETARVGERINSEVYRQIQAHDRVLLVCSKHSLDRSGVINEIQETLDREARDGGATYLLPVMLDDYVLTGWKAKQPVLAERIGRRVIADYRNARRSRKRFDAAVDRVIDALKLRRTSA